MTSWIHRFACKLLRGAALASLFVVIPSGGNFGSLITRASQQTSHKKGNKQKKPPVDTDLPVPFKAGEKLNYQVGWSAFVSAASVQLSVPEKRDFYGTNTWHFRATAHTQGTARSLFTIDDEFDSYTDTSMNEGRQFEMYLNEMGKKQDQQLHFVVEGQPNKAPGVGVVVLAGTRDPLGALYLLRTVDWEKTEEVHGPVYDGRDVFEMTAKREVLDEKVNITAGNYSATRVSIHVSQHGKEMKEIDFSVWVAHDAAHTPVLMQAELPFGSLRIELTSSSNSGTSNSTSASQ